jgi:hypothetical protein
MYKYTLYDLHFLLTLLQKVDDGVLLLLCSAIESFGIVLGSRFFLQILDFLLQGGTAVVQCVHTKIRNTTLYKVCDSASSPPPVSLCGGSYSSSLPAFSAFLVLRAFAGGALTTLPVPVKIECSSVKRETS